MDGLTPEPGAALDGLGLLRLLSWLSPAFPTGAFGWSHGLEAAIAEGRIGDAAGTEAWIAALVERGSGWNDLVLFAAAWRAARAGDAAGLAALAELALALAGSFERRAETAALGAAFAEAAGPWREGGTLARAPSGEPYPVAVARLCGAAGLPLDAALLAFAHGFAANLLSAAVRLVPLGQTRATVVLKGLEPVLERTAARAARSSLDDLGQAALWSDIAAMRHETLQPRLFRS